MAIDPGSVIAIIQAVRLGVAMVDDLTRLLDRIHAEQRDPTEDELRLIAVKRQDANESYDAMLRKLGVEPGSGRRIS